MPQAKNRRELLRTPSARSSRSPDPDGLPLTAPAPDDGEDDYRYVDWGADL
jgi:hypothetical protein